MSAISLPVLSPKRVAGSLAVALGGMWLALAGTLPAVLAQRAPGLVLAVRPFSATALAARAAQGLDAAGATPSAVADARHALALGPTQLKAWRVLAVDAFMHGDLRRAQGTLDYAERLSRRDPAIQLALIEQRVVAKDVVGALVHYDRVLRTSRSAAPALIPVLVQAAADPAIVRPLAQMLATRPPWWRDLASSLIAPGPHVAAIGPIYRALRLDATRPEEASLLAQGMSQLVTAQRPADAAALFRQATGQSAGALRNGGFDATSTGLVPFDWYLGNEPGLSAAIDTPEGRTDPALLLIAARKPGVAARQLLLLRTGRHRLRFLGGGVAGDAAPLVVLRCADAPERVLFSQPVTAGGGDLVVPPACTAQWLSVDVTTPILDGMPWVDQLRIDAAR